MGMKVQDVGWTNKDEQGKKMYNQCFYLALANSWQPQQSGTEKVNDTALALKRTIEKSVIARHPNWKQRIKENSAAFADYVFDAMTLQPKPINEWAVAIFEYESGTVETFCGPEFFNKNGPLLWIWHIPMHYQAVTMQGGGRPTMSFCKLLQTLDKYEIPHIETLVEAQEK
jgi:hypothetical protein